MEIIELEKPVKIVEPKVQSIDGEHGGKERWITKVYSDVTSQEKIEVKFFAGYKKEVDITHCQEQVLDAWFTLALNGCEVFSATQLCQVVHFLSGYHSFYVDENELNFEEEMPAWLVRQNVIEPIKEMSSVDMRWKSVDDDGNSPSIKAKTFAYTQFGSSDNGNIDISYQAYCNNIWGDELERGYVSFAIIDEETNECSSDTSSYSMRVNEWIPRGKRQLWTAEGKETTADKVRSLEQWLCKDEYNEDSIDGMIRGIIGNFLFNKLKVAEYPRDEMVDNFLTPVFNLDNYIKYKQLEDEGEVWNWWERDMSMDGEITPAEWKSDLEKHDVKLAGFIFNDPRNNFDYKKYAKKKWTADLIESLIDEITYAHGDVELDDDAWN